MRNLYQIVMLPKLTKIVTDDQKTAFSEHTERSFLPGFIDPVKLI